MTRTIGYWEEDSIRNLLMFRKVVKVQDDIMVLDNGTVLRVLPNDGCSGCSAGNYYLEALNTVNNAIMNVEFDCEYENTDSWEPNQSYRIFVYADGIGKQELLRVDGNDGNGYYGSGYKIAVIVE